MVVEQPPAARAPEGDAFSQWAAQSAQQQVGSGHRTSGSGLALADGEADDSDQNHVWGDDRAADHESVLCGNGSEGWKNADPEAFDPGELLEPVHEEPAPEEPPRDDEPSAEVELVEPAQAAAESAIVDLGDGDLTDAAAETTEAEEEDDTPSVDVAGASYGASYGARGGRSQGYAGRPARPSALAGSMPHPLVMVGGAIGVLLVIVAIGMAVVKPNSRHSSTKGRRNPQEFQDFARDAAKRGWR